MTKLWDKGSELDKGIEQFTVGEDYLLDHHLIEADVAGSIAHAQMLAKIGILKQDEFKKIKAALLDVLKSYVNSEFEIKKEDEDVHTAIENYLTKKLGNIGKKIHTARSRNDQVVLDLRLYTKDKIFETKKNLLGLIGALVELAEKGKDIPFAGRTHTQPAMPSSIGLWAGAYAESFLDDLKILNNAYELNDQCPIGSAASYGVSLPIDRELVSDLLGFKKVQNNVLYGNNSRGKIESVVIGALSQIEIDLSKLANDMIFFSIPELGYFEIPDEFCTGSSIMPNKKNPDVLELVRAKSNKVLAAQFQVLNLIKDLPSGYNRDLQETKEPLMESLWITNTSLNIMTVVTAGLKLNKEKCLESCKPEIFATDKAITLAAKGKPWRDAYLEVAQNLDSLKEENPVNNIKNKKHVGATGNLGLSKSLAKIKAEKIALDKEKKGFEAAISKLLK